MIIFRQRTFSEENKLKKTRSGRGYVNSQILGLGAPGIVSVRAGKHAADKEYKKGGSDYEVIKKARKAGTLAGLSAIPITAAEISRLGDNPKERMELAAYGAGVGALRAIPAMIGGNHSAGMHTADRLAKLHDRERKEEQDAINAEERKYSLFEGIFKKKQQGPQLPPDRQLIKNGKIDKDELAESILEYENMYPEYSVLKGNLNKDFIKNNLKVKYDKDFDDYTAEVKGVNSGWWSISVGKDGRGGVSYND